MCAVVQDSRCIGPGAGAVRADAAEQRGAVDTLTVLLATAVPVSVRVLSLVMPSPTTPLSVENDVMLGAARAALLTVTFNAADAALVVPAVSVAVAVRL